MTITIEYGRELTAFKHIPWESFETSQTGLHKVRFVFIVPRLSYVRRFARSKGSWHSSKIWSFFVNLRPRPLSPSEKSHCRPSMRIRPRPCNWDQPDTGNVCSSQRMTSAKDRSGSHSRRTFSVNWEDKTSVLLACSSVGLHKCH